MTDPKNNPPFTLEERLEQTRKLAEEVNDGVRDPSSLNMSVGYMPDTCEVVLTFLGRDYALTLDVAESLAAAILDTVQMVRREAML